MTDERKYPAAEHGAISSIPSSMLKDGGGAAATGARNDEVWPYFIDGQPTSRQVADAYVKLVEERDEAERRAAAVETEVERLRAERAEMMGSNADQFMLIETAEIERLRAALTRLVDLKDGPHDSVYLREKPKAWEAARAILGRALVVDNNERGSDFPAAFTESENPHAD